MWEPWAKPNLLEPSPRKWVRTGAKCLGCLGSPCPDSWLRSKFPTAPTREHLVLLLSHCEPCVPLLVCPRRGFWPGAPMEDCVLPALLSGSPSRLGRHLWAAHLQWESGFSPSSSGSSGVSVDTGRLLWHWNSFSWGIRPAGCGTKTSSLFSPYTVRVETGWLVREMDRKHAPIWQHGAGEEGG